LRKKADRNREKSKREQAPDSSARFERLLEHASAIGHYSLRLYITGTTMRSNRAVAEIRALCEELLPGKYDLEVVDIYQQPAKAMDAQIIAAPTLVKVLPKPLKRFIGDLSDRKKVAAGLNLTGKGTGTDAEDATV
jgi:circadian clock protein KaiB